MSIKPRLIVPVTFLILAALACNFSPATVPPSLDAVGTAAAQTIAANLASQAQITNSPAASEVASSIPTVIPSNTPVSSVTPICDQALFVSETIPDGSTFAAGTSFTKTWRLRNNGNCTWTSSYAIVFDNGDALGAPAAVSLSGNVAPGQEVDIPVNMVAPGVPGTFTGYWRLRNASGVLFGIAPGNTAFWVKITVVPPTPTATTAGPHVIIPILPHLPVLLAPSSQQVFVQVTAPAGGIGHSVANCPSGTVLTGGGYAGNTSLQVYNSSATGNGWEVYAQNTSGSGQLLNSYAICLSGTTATSQQVVSQVPVGANGIGNAQANCPSGTVLTGGGYAATSDLQVYNSSANGNAWQVYARNTSASGQTLNSYAICLSSTTATSQQVVSQVTAPANSVGHAVANCPSGTVLTGGGYAVPSNLSVYDSSATGSGWEVDAQNTSASGQLLNAYVICTTFP